MAVCAGRQPRWLERSDVSQHQCPQRRLRCVGHGQSSDTTPPEGVCAAVAMFFFLLYLYCAVVAILYFSCSAVAVFFL